MPNSKTNEKTFNARAKSIECNWAKELLLVSQNIQSLRFQIEEITEFLEQHDTTNKFLNGCEVKTAQMEAEMLGLEEQLFDEANSTLNYEDYHDMIVGADQKVTAWQKESLNIMSALKSFDDISAVQQMHRECAQKPAKVKSKMADKILGKPANVECSAMRKKH